MTETPTKYTAETEDGDEMINIVQACKMACAIGTYHDCVIRPLLKYGDLPADQYEIVEKVAEGLREHFEDIQIIY